MCSLRFRGLPTESIAWVITSAAVDGCIRYAIGCTGCEQPARANPLIGRKIPGCSDRSRLTGGKMRRIFRPACRSYRVTGVSKALLARPEGFEPPTLGLEGRRQCGMACHGVPVTHCSHVTLLRTGPEALHGVAGGFRRGNRRQLEPELALPPRVP